MSYVALFGDELEIALFGDELEIALFGPDENVFVDQTNRVSSGVFYDQNNTDTVATVSSGSTAVYFYTLMNQ